MTYKPLYIAVRIAGIVFGLILPLPIMLVYSMLVGPAVPALFRGEDRLSIAGLLIWGLAGWIGLASIFSVLVRRNYSSRAINLWQISGFLVGIVAATPVIIMEGDAFAQHGTIYPDSLFPLSVAGPIMVAVVCLVKFKWKIGKNQAEASRPSS
jgi:hypothetical protein